VVKYADEWNAIFSLPAEFSRLNARLDGLLKAAGRDPGSVRRSMMTGLRFGRTKKELEAKLSERGQTVEELHKRGIIIGVGDDIKQHLKELEKTGLQRLMLQWLDLDDLKGLSNLAKVVL
jgi:alkanesulfonate monooxygenase SsuD/methylene tetrahydromethanopterin reductase-like flavin-dependent oxidoreductase (luciferase family)